MAGQIRRLLGMCCYLARVLDHRKPRVYVEKVRNHGALLKKRLAMGCEKRRGRSVWQESHSRRDLYGCYPIRVQSPSHHPG